MKQLAKVLSYITHPILLPTAFTFLYIAYCPQDFASIEPKQLLLLKLQTVFNTIMYPLVVVLLLWKLDFAKDIYLRTTRERLVPLMATILFYFWNFYALHKLSSAPLMLKSFLLGTFFVVSLLFFISIFAKVSMHTAGMAGFATMLSLLSLYCTCMPILFAIIAAVLLFAVAASRLILQEHTKAEVLLGALVGVVCHVAVYYLYKG
jgi:membrane-associated phospholipid phosphatase